MADLVTRLRLDSSQHNQELEKSKQKVSQYKDEADKAGKSLEDMGQKQSRSAKDLLKAMSEIEGTTRSTSNYKAQLAQISKQIQDLTINYRAMNQEMQNSEFGREVADKISELTQRASEYKDAILDAQQSVKVLASDTANWDAAKQGIDVVSSSLQAFVSMGVLGEKSTEKLVAVIAKLKAMETATNAVIKVGNALQKQSSLMIGITKVQTAALAKAKNLEAAATGKATIAQRLFNAVAKANPYVLLATAVITVVTALAIFSRKSNDVKKAAKEESEAVKAAREEFENYQKSLASTTGDILSKYRVLQIQYSKLRSEHEKVQWIQKNKTEFENLGLKVKDLKSAEDAFVNNSSNVIEALKKRAKAMANQNRLTQLYEKMMEEELKATDNYATQAKKIGDKYFGDINERNRHMFNMANDGSWVYNAKGVEEENKKIKANCFATVDAIQSKIDETAGEIASELDMSSILGSGSSGGTTTSKVKYQVESGSLKEAQSKVSELQEQLNHMSPNNENFIKTKNELESWKKKVEEIQEILQSAKPQEIYEPGSLSEASHFVSAFQKQLQDLNPDTDEFEEVNELLNIWKARQEEINKKINNTKEEAKSVVEQYQEIVSKASEVSLKYKIGAIDKTEAERQIKELNDELKGLNLTATVSLEIDDNGIDATQFDKALEKFTDIKDKVGGVVSSISSAYSSIADLGERLNDENDKVKQFFMVWEAGMNVVNAATTTLQALAPVINALTAATELSAAAKRKEAEASAENTIANEAESGSVLKSAIAKMMEAIAGGAKAVSSLGPIGPILAIAAAASITAALIAAFSKAKAQKFSQGGIFKSNSSVNDKNWARLNDGEMVLNTQQQRKLFQMLNSSGVMEKNSYPDFGDVHFVIEGDKLVGTFSNYNRKIGHSKR